jgi:hypothetical protein
VINACECSPYARDTSGPAYTAMHDYIFAGGRFFGSHYHYNWFAQPTGPADFQAVAKWTPSGGCDQAGIAQYPIDTSFPKGQAFSDWLKNVGASTTPGQLPMYCAPMDVGDQVQPISQRWIYSSVTNDPKYLSFNAPMDAGKDDAGEPMYCGRAVYADVHVSYTGQAGDNAGMTFPTGCVTKTLNPQEAALEFMLFDLSSCIQKDTEPPKPPPVK